MIPPLIVSASTRMNLVTSMHAKELYGIDFIDSYQASKADMECAKDLYEEYKAYSNCLQGDEYDLVEYFVESLDLENYFTIASEDLFKAEGGKTFAQIEEEYETLKKLEVGAEKPLTDEQQERQKRFDEQHTGEDPMITMMMSMYMCGALEYFEGWTKEEIKKTAFEIAMLGMNGISPDKKSGYKVPSIDKDMGGYQMLAYYYVSWAIAIPEMLPQLRLGAFDAAYQQAKNLWELKRGKK